MFIFLLNVSFPAAWAPPFILTFGEKVFSVHFAVRIRPCPKNKPDIHPVQGSVQAIYAVQQKHSQPPDSRRELPGCGHTPRKLPARPQSPASSHFSPYGRNFPNRRSAILSDFFSSVKGKLYFFIHLYISLYPGQKNLVFLPFFPSFQQKTRGLCRPLVLLFFILMVLEASLPPARQIVFPEDAIVHHVHILTFNQLLPAEEPLLDHAALLHHPA